MDFGITNAQAQKATAQSGFTAKAAKTASCTAHGRHLYRQAVRDKNFAVRPFSASIDNFYDIAETNDCGSTEGKESIGISCSVDGAIEKKPENG